MEHVLRDSILVKMRIMVSPIQRTEFRSNRFRTDGGTEIGGEMTHTVPDRRYWGQVGLTPRPQPSTSHDHGILDGRVPF